METEDVAFAKLWAGMQVPPVTVRNYMPEWSIDPIPIWMNLQRDYFTENAAWSKLAYALAPIRHSLEPAILRMRGVE